MPNLRSRDNGPAVHIAWIPSSFAKVGKVLRLKFDGVWNDGWKVTAIYESLPAAHIEVHKDDYKHQREASDI